MSVVSGSPAAPEKAGFSDVLKRFSRQEIGRLVTSLDAAFLLERYGDQLVEGKDLPSIASFYFDKVAAQRLDPNPTFSEAGYLQRNLDVADAVLGGSFVSGFHHWLVHGEKEGRVGGKIFKRRSQSRLLKLSEIDISRGLASFTPEEIAELLLDTGAVSFEDYMLRYPDLARSGVDPILHFVQWGHKEGRIIHELFDHQYYVEKYPDVEESGVFPLVEYLFEGAKKGRQPHAFFDVREYANRYNVDLEHSNPLIHYSLNKASGVKVNTPFFDEEYYLATYPETASYPGGPFLHFSRHGIYEGRRPNANFNPRYYYAKHLNNDYSINAFQHYIEQGAALGLETDLPKSVPTISREIGFFANQGPRFEELDVNLGKGRQKRAKLVAFYLPQFHSFPENDEWWGKGFSEWRNIPRGVPRFVGHYQPRIPRDLSFYDLSDPKVMERQVEMALDMGLYGFCFYFYWFDRHRLMEGPLDRFVADKSLKMPFMVLWANENWTRRWDGMEAEVLIKQNQNEEDDVALVDCFQSYFADERYIRLNGRPLLVIYRADILKDSAATIKRWKTLFIERHNEDPLIFLAQTFKAEDPYKFGFDGAIEFPPHKLGNMIKPINDKLNILDWDFSGQVFSYEAGVEASLTETTPRYPHIKTVFPSWDNNARRQTGGTVYNGSTPELFGKWLDGAINYARENPVESDSIVFLNAWNEWAEGAYLEPDIHLGGAMLNTLARTVAASDPAYGSAKMKVLLVGHDAFPAGAQINLLEMAKVLQDRFGLDVHVILLGEGALLENYKQAVPTTLCEQDDIYTVISGLSQRGFKFALTNTTGASSLARLLKEVGYHVVALVHELPHTIKTGKMEVCAEVLRERADHVVFASNFVRDAFVSEFGDINGNTVVRPQGIYKTFERDERHSESIRTELGIPSDAKIVLNVAYGDLRKGIDLFCNTAREMAKSNPNYHFVWVGEIHLWVEQWLLTDVVRQKFSNIHFLGMRTDIDRWMSGADVFFLTSREDPFPSVVMEAMQVGLPIVAFDENGGYTDLLRADEQLGVLVRQNDMDEAVRAILGSESTPDLVAYRAEKARVDFNFADYMFDLLKLFKPDLQKVSVVVPNYNYDQYIRARLNSIFEQSYPIYELIVLDDCSLDKSLDEIRATIADCGRVVTVVSNVANSGSVFAQWGAAIERITGELLWISEADDLAEPILVEELAKKHSKVENCVFAFSDSLSIDENGITVFPSYIPYAESISPGLLDGDRVFDVREFAEKGLGIANLILNVSSVLWNVDSLKSNFELAKPELAKVKLVGDWMIYLLSCSGLGRIAFDSRQLNIHRRHSTSVTQALHRGTHLDEIRQMHTLATKITGKRTLSKAQAKYLRSVETKFNDTTAE